MSLHNTIMNIPATGADDYDNLPNEKVAYKIGHHDARHEAAEMALAQDEIIEQLKEALLKAKQWHQGDKWRYDYEEGHHDAWQQQADCITEALRYGEPWST